MSLTGRGEKMEGKVDKEGFMSELLLMKEQADKLNIGGEGLMQGLEEVLEAEMKGVYANSLNLEEAVRRINLVESLKSGQLCLTYGEGEGEREGGVYVKKVVGGEVKELVVREEVFSWGVVDKWLEGLEEDRLSWLEAEEGEGFIKKEGNKL